MQSIGGAVQYQRSSSRMEGGTVGKCFTGKAGTAGWRYSDAVLHMLGIVMLIQMQSDEWGS